MGMAGFPARFFPAAFAALLVALAGCSSVPPQTDPDIDAVVAPRRADADIGAGAARHALDVVGVPYRFGGSTPDGFDCSGLIQYSYGLAGRQLPRDTEGLRTRTRPVPLAQARPGDLLFFHLNGRRNSHVGLHIGDNSFVHAPSTGKHVSTASLSNPFWRRHFAGARRPHFD